MCIYTLRGNGRSGTEYYVSAATSCLLQTQAAQILSQHVRRGWGTEITPGSLRIDCCSSLYRQLPPLPNSEDFFFLFAHWLVKMSRQCLNK